MELFVEYWRPTKKERPEQPTFGCNKCSKCSFNNLTLNDVEQSLNEETHPIKCICIFCNKNVSDSKESQAMLQELKDNAFYTTTLDKVITSATENTFMPLVQLSIVFPQMLYLFPKETINQAFQSVNQAKLNITSDSAISDIQTTLVQNTNMETNWKFVITTISIITSFISMASQSSLQLCSLYRS